MLFNLIKFVLVILFCVVSHTMVYCQVDASSPSNRPTAQKDDDFPETFRESIAKRRIKEEEKTYEDLLQRGEEAVKLSEQLTASYESHKSLTAEDSKKIERLEKVVKKIRQDLGAKSDSEESLEEKEEKPSTLKNVLVNIKETTSELLSELKKTTRHSISVVAVQSSNTLLKLVRFAKFSKD